VFIYLIVFAFIGEFNRYSDICPLFSARISRPTFTELTVEKAHVVAAERRCNRQTDRQTARVARLSYQHDAIEPATSDAVCADQCHLHREANCASPSPPLMRIYMRLYALDACSQFLWLSYRAYICVYMMQPDQQIRRVWL